MTNKHVKVMQKKKKAEARQVRKGIRGFSVIRRPPEIKRQGLSRRGVIE